MLVVVRTLGGRWLSLTPYYYYFLNNKWSIDLHCDCGHMHRKHTSYEHSCSSSLERAAFDTHLTLPLEEYN